MAIFASILLLAGNCQTLPAPFSDPVLEPNFAQKLVQFRFCFWVLFSMSSGVNSRFCFFLFFSLDLPTDSWWPTAGCRAALSLTPEAPAVKGLFYPLTAACAPLGPVKRNTGGFTLVGDPPGAHPKRQGQRAPAPQKHPKHPETNKPKAQPLYKRINAWIHMRLYTRNTSENRSWSFMPKQLPSRLCTGKTGFLE